MNSVARLLSCGSVDLYYRLYRRGWIHANEILGDDGPSSSSPHRKLRMQMGKLRGELVAIGSDQMVVSDHRGYKLTDDRYVVAKWLQTQDAQARARYTISHKIRRSLRERNPRQRELFL